MLSYEEKIACRENGTRSKTAWLHSLNHGCLNKSCGVKFRCYSHLKAFSSRKLEPVSYSVLYNSLPRSGASDIKLSEERTTGDLPGSPVIMENLSRPPEVLQETEPVFFTVEEFFEYLYSKKWSRKICLRVIGGQLLRLILNSLSVMEQNYMLNSHVIYAHLNNRQWVDSDVNTSPSKNSTAASTSSNMRKIDNHWQYEKMKVKLVFYDKADLSNIPYVILDTQNASFRSHTSSSSSAVTNLQFPPEIPMTRDIRCPPVSTQLHRLNRIRLPQEEHDNTPERIAELTSMLEKLRTQKEGIDQRPVQDVNKEKGVTTLEAKKAEEITSEAVEMMAEDPVLVRKKPSLVDVVQANNRLGSLATSGGPVLQQDAQQDTLNVLAYDKTSAKVEDKEMSLKGDVATTEEVTTIAAQGIDPRKSMMGDITSSEEAAKTMQNNDPRKILTATNGEKAAIAVQSIELRKSVSFKLNKELGVGDKLSQAISSSKTEALTDRLSHETIEGVPFQDSLEEPILARLNLSGNELYVTSLYNPRTDNKQWTLAKLRKRKRTQRKCVQTLTQVKESSAYSQPRTRTQPRKGLAAVSSSTAKSKKTLKSLELRKHWSEYRVDQEELEMEAALENKLEKGLLERLAKMKEKVVVNTVEEVTKSVKKGVKNKSQNKGDTEDNVLTLNESEFCTQSHSGRVRSSLLTDSGMHSSSHLQEEVHGKYESKRKGTPVSPCLLQLLVDWRDCLDEGVSFESDEALGFSGMKNIFYSQNKLPGISQLMMSYDQAVSLQRASLKQEKNVYLHLNVNDNSVPSFQRENLRPNTGSPTSLQGVSLRSGSHPKVSSEASGHLVDRAEETGQARRQMAELLQNFKFDCSCQECSEQEARLADLMGSSLDKAQYSLCLGHLRKGHIFLDWKDSVEKKSSTDGRSFQSLVSTAGTTYVSEQLLKNMDTLIIRKEILSSSLGHTYTTVTFTRNGAFQKIITL